MAVRFKEIETCLHYGYDGERWTCLIDWWEKVPIEDWSIHPLLLSPPTYTKGETLPSPQSISVQFPELWEWVERLHNEVVFGLETVYTNSNAEWLTVTSPELMGDSFQTVNLKNTNLQVAFKNLTQLTEGIHTAAIRLKAFWKKPSGNEFVEFAPQNIEVRIDIKNGSNPPPTDNPNPPDNPNLPDNPPGKDDLPTKKLTYNKTTQQLSGDTEVPELSKYGSWDYDTTIFKHLNLIRNADLSGSFRRNDFTQQLANGNYNYTISISYFVSPNWWVLPKEINLPITLNVIEGNGLDFTVSPKNFSFTASRLPGEVRSGTAVIQNENNNNVEVLVKPSFIASAVVENGRLNFSTANSSTLAVGDYSGEIVLVARNATGQEATQRVAVSLKIVEQLKSDFHGEPYYFAMDRHKITVNKTNANASYVKVILSMHYQGFGEYHQENQEYIYPYFGGKVEFLPGKEVQDFFIQLKSFEDLKPTEYQYHLAIVNILVKECDANDKELSESRIDGLFFAPGKKPKCFPIFTDCPTRRTFKTSKIRLNTDIISNHLVALGIPALPSKMEIHAFNFDRKHLSAGVSSVKSVNFVPFPEPKNGKLIHLFFENQNLVLDWFSCPADHQRKFDFTHITNDTNGEKFSALETETLILNTGWILREEIELVNAIIKSRICFIMIEDTIIKARAMSKKNEMHDTAENLYSMDLEFNIKQNER